MSSTASATLTLELRPPWALLAAGCTWLALLVAGIAHSAAPGVLKLTLVISTLLPGLSVFASQLFGLAPGALRRVQMDPDGGWLLTDSRDRHWPAKLRSSSRPVAGCTLLSWQGALESHWALVAARAANRDALRLLRVRLRLR